MDEPREKSWESGATALRFLMVTSKVPAVQRYAVSMRSCGLRFYPDKERLGQGVRERGLGTYPETLAYGFRVTYPSLGWVCGLGRTRF